MVRSFTSKTTRRLLVQGLHALVVAALLAQPLTVFAAPTGRTPANLNPAGGPSAAPLEVTVTPTGEPSATPPLEPSATPEPTSTGEPTATPTQETLPTPTATVEPTATTTLDVTATPTVTLTATVEPTVTLTIEPTSTLTITPLPTFTPAPVVTDTTGMITTTIDPDLGGELVVNRGLGQGQGNGRPWLRVQFPPHAVPGRAVVQFQPLTLPRNARANAHVVLAQMFQLTAEDRPGNGRPDDNPGNGTPRRQFNQPLTITLDLSDWGPALDARTLWFGYFDDTTQTWNAIPFWVTGEGTERQLVATVDHFTNFGVGNDPNPGWKLSYREPQTSLFSGAATTDFPLTFPAGRGGLAPSLSLVYNSRVVDHNRSWSQSDWVGHGWSIDAIDITRRLGDNTTQNQADCTTDYTLALNGASYRLTLGAEGWYYPEDSNVVRAKLNTGSPSNATGEYWEVQNGAGVTYTLGNTTDSEQGIGCIGTGLKAFRWRVNRVADNNGNVMVFTYEEETTNCQFGCDSAHYSRASYLKRIEYNNQTPYQADNFLTKIELNLATRPTGGNNDGGGGYNYLFYQSQYLDNITVKVDNFMVRKYQLGYQLFVDSVRQEYGGTGSRELVAITETAYNATSVLTLPVTTFTYQMLGNSNSSDCMPNVNCGPGPNNGGWSDNQTWDCRWYSYFPDARDAFVNWWQYGLDGPYASGYAGNPSNCREFNFWHLSEVRNGYGAKSTFGYEADQAAWWTGGNTYRVVTRTVAGSETGPATVWNYQYGQACYNATIYLPAGAVACLLPPPAKPDHSLVGHSSATAIVRDYNGTVLQTQTSYFKIGEESSRLLGRVYRTETRDGAGNLLTAQDTSHAVLEMGANPTRWLTYVDGTSSRQYGYGGRPDQSHRTTLTHNDYGQVTSQIDYGWEEYVANPGFEGSLSGWPGFGATTNTSTTATVAFAGRRVLSLNGSTNGGVYQDLSGLVPGFTYTVRAWVKAAPGSTAQFSLWVHDGVGNHQQTPATTYGSSNWTLVTLDYAAPTTGTMRVHLFYANVGNGGAIYVDEVAVARQGSANDGRTVINEALNLTDARWLIGLPWRTRTYTGVVAADNPGATLVEQITFYDGATTDPFNQTGFITRGLVTKAGQGLWTGKFVSTTTQYDAWGQAVRTVDARGNVMTTTYDALWHLYPVQMQNALGHVSTVEYDLRLGQPTTMTDANGAVTTMVYDAAGRIYEQYRPGDAANDPSQRWLYLDTANPPQLSPFNIRTQQKPGSFNLAQRQFYDGMGRVIQTHSARDVTLDGATGNKDIVTSVGYDALGRVISQTVPYSVPTNSTGNVYTTLNLATAPATLTRYDGLGRTSMVTAPDGTTTQMVYGEDTTIALDPAGQPRLTFVDGLGRTIAVNETYRVWGDDFGDGNLATPATTAWTGVGGVSESGGVGRISGANAYLSTTVGAERTGGIISFYYDGASGTKDLVALRAGTFGQSSYRRWGVQAEAGVLSRIFNEGTGAAQTVPLLTLKNNTWYRAMLRSGGAGNQSFILAVWEKDNPGHSAVWREVKATWPTTYTWAFVAQNVSGSPTLLVDDFARLDYYQTNYTYNTLDQLTQVKDTLGNTTVLTYNVLGQKTGMLDPDMGKWGYLYDDAGNLTQQTDARGCQTTFTYDSLNRLTNKDYTLTGCAGVSATNNVLYTYDGTNSARVEAEAPTTQSGGAMEARNAASNGHLVGGGWGGSTGHFAEYVNVSTGLAGPTVLHLRYVRPQTTVGRLNVYVDGVLKGQLTLIPTQGGWGDAVGDYAEAALHLGPLSGSTHTIKLVAPANGSNANLDYFYFSTGARGQRSQMSANTSLAAWQYDARGRVITESKTIDNVNYTTGLGYDLLDRPVTTTYPTGEVVVQTYNNLGAAENLRSNTYGQWYVSNMDYDGAGRLTTLVLSNSVMTTRYNYYAWNQQGGRLQQIKTTNASTTLQDLAYNYDPLGNITTLADAATFFPNTQTQHFTYDSLNRLTAGKTTGYGTPSTGAYTETYGYNAIGNFITKTQGVTTTTYTYADAAHKHAVTSLSSGNAYAYDAAGNMSTRTESGVTYQQKWNAENLLAEVTNTSVSPNRISKFTYDGDGARVKMEEFSGSTLLTTTLYLGAVEIRSANSIRTWTTYYGTFAMRETASETGLNNLYFLHADHLGSTSLVTTASGAAHTKQLYHPYGTVRYVANVAMPTAHTYTGQIADAGTGLMYYRARYYSASLGRFISADTLIPNAGSGQAYNRYMYVNGNPLRFMDPTGHYACGDGEARECSSEQEKYTKRSAMKLGVEGKGVSKKAFKPQQPDAPSLYDTLARNLGMGTHSYDIGSPSLDVGIWAISAEGSASATVSGPDSTAEITPDDWSISVGNVTANLNQVEIELGSNSASSQAQAESTAVIGVKIDDGDVVLYEGGNVTHNVLSSDYSLDANGSFSVEARYRPQVAGTAVVFVAGLAIMYFTLGRVQPQQVCGLAGVRC